MAVVDFDPSKISKVNIDLVIPNTWNPKEKDTKEFKKVKESIFNKGLRGFIAVRNHPEKEGHYEIIDGEQRHTASKELGYEEVHIYNEGNVDDKEAKELTIWWQQQVPFEQIQEAYLITDMLKEYQIDNIELPYTEAEIKTFENLAKFSFEDYNQENPNDDEKDRNTLKISLMQEQYEIVMKAIKSVQQENDCNEARALELLCADYLAGASEN